MNKVIPIKKGAPYQNTEAYVNLETKQFEETPWNQGPSNSFYREASIVSRPFSKEGEVNYKKIFGHK